jgi:hypothetical protein
MVCLSQVEGDLIATERAAAAFPSWMRYASPFAIEKHHNPVDRTARALFILRCSNYVLPMALWIRIALGATGVSREKHRILAAFAQDAGAQRR